VEDMTDKRARATSPSLSMNIHREPGQGEDANSRKIVGEGNRRRPTALDLMNDEVELTGGPYSCKHRRYYS